MSHSFPTRRSSDLVGEGGPHLLARNDSVDHAVVEGEFGGLEIVDRNSTRLNSSHTVISYAVFCLKKKMHEPMNALSKTSRSPASYSAAKALLGAKGLAITGTSSDRSSVY